MGIRKLYWSYCVLCIVLCWSIVLLGVLLLVRK